jgi:DNA-binding transcriptional LysR family regulator
MRKSHQIERRLKLHDLRVLVTVAQAGSMLKAAQHLNTSQPAISRSIAKLEQELGVRLLDRSRQGVEPTIYGRALLDCGTALFDDLRQVIKNIEFLADPTEGELRIGGNFPGFAGVIPATINRFRRKYPRIHVHADIVSELPQQHRVLRERSVDFFLGRLPQPVAEDLETETLFQEGLVIVAGAHSPWARRRNIQLAELVGEPWLMPAADSVVGSHVIHAFRASGLEAPIGVTTGAVLYMQSLITDGDFLGFYPSSPLRLGTVGVGFKVLRVDLTIPPSPFGILRLKNRTLSAVAELFIACAREIVKPLAQK